MSDGSTRNSVALPQETIFELLSDSGRRAVIDCLDRHDTTLSLADTAEEVAERLYDQPLPEITDEDVKAVYLTLYHAHIPKLARYEVVHYDQESDLVCATERTAVVAEYLDDQFSQ